MPTIIISTIEYPSYVTLDEANAYMAVDPFFGPAWATYTDLAKQGLLITATRLLQALPWCDPAPDIDSPAAIVKAVAIQLAGMIGADPVLAAPGGAAGQSGGDAAIRRAKAGSVEVEYFRADSFAAVLVIPNGFPAGLWALLKAAGLVGCNDDPIGGAGYSVQGNCGSYFPYDGLVGCARCGCAPGASCGCGPY